jgi:hypothetical protein
LSASVALVFTSLVGVVEQPLMMTNARMGNAAFAHVEFVVIEMSFA